MEITELHDEDEIYQIITNHWHLDDAYILPPLFHGTDASLIGMSKQEREVINEACEVIIKSIYRIFKDNSISITNKTLMSVKDSYGNAANAYVKAEGRINKSYLYSYGDFYVTNLPDRACGYSRESWILGETGEVTNLLVEGACALGLALPNDMVFNKAYEIYDGRKQKSKDPVVLVITDCKCSELYEIRGRISIEDKEATIRNYAKSIKGKSIGDSFIIGEETLVNNAGIYLIKPSLYNSLFQIYESI